MFRQLPAVHWEPGDIPPSGAQDPEFLKRDFLLGIEFPDYELLARRIFPALLASERQGCPRHALHRSGPLPVLVCSAIGVDPTALATANPAGLLELARSHPALPACFLLLQANARFAGTHLGLAKKYLFRPQDRRDAEDIPDNALVSNRKGTTGMTENLLSRLTQARRAHLLLPLAQLSAEALERSTGIPHAARMHGRALDDLVHFTDRRWRRDGPSHASGRPLRMAPLPMAAPDLPLKVGLVQAARRVAGTVGIVAVGFGALALAFDVTASRGIVPWEDVHPYSALGVLLLGAGLWSMTRKPAGHRSVLIVILGLLTVIVGGLDVAAHASVDAAMALVPGSCFLLLAFACVGMCQQSHRLVVAGQICALAATFVALIAFDDRLHRYWVLTENAEAGEPSPATLLVITLLAFGTVVARPQEGITAAMVSDSVAGALGRRMLLAAIVVPLVLGWTPVAVDILRISGRRFADVVLVTASVAVFGAVSFLATAAAARLEAAEISGARKAQEGHARLLALIDHTSAVIYMRGLDGQYLLVNREYERLFGVRRENIVGLTDHDLFPGEIADDFRANDLMAISPGSPVRMEETAPGDDGARTYITVKFPLMDDTGRAYAICGISTDITERKRAEEEVRRLNEELEERVRQRTAELEASTRELDAFAYSVSHDLRAPLRSLAGFSEVLLEDYADRLDDDRPGLPAPDRGQRRPDGPDDRRPARPVPGHPRRTAPRTRRRQCRSPATSSTNCATPTRAVTCRPSIADGLVASGDPHLIRLVLHNLLGNAWKFTARTVPARHPRSTPSSGTTTPVFTVSDNGAGFDMRYVAKLFDPFQRLHSTTDFEGTGIGLAIVHRIVQRHGGRIWAESEPGQGATFFFTLAGSAAEGPSRHERRRRSCSSRTTPTTCCSPCARFEKNNIDNEIVVAVDGEQALRHLLPADGDGGAAARPGAARREAAEGRRARGAAPDPGRPADTASLPVVVLTTSSEERDIMESYRLGRQQLRPQARGVRRVRRRHQVLGVYWLLVNEPAPRWRARAEPMTDPCLLIVEDSDDDAVLLVRQLRRAGLTSATSRRGDRRRAARRPAGPRSPTCVICDYNMPAVQRRRGPGQSATSRPGRAVHPRVRRGRRGDRGRADAGRRPRLRPQGPAHPARARRPAGAARGRRPSRAAAGRSPPCATARNGSGCSPSTRRTSSSAAGGSPIRPSSTSARPSPPSSATTPTSYYGDPAQLLRWWSRTTGKLFEASWRSPSPDPLTVRWRRSRRRARIDGAAGRAHPRRRRPGRRRRGHPTRHHQRVSVEQERQRLERQLRQNERLDSPRPARRRRRARLQQPAGRHHELRRFRG